MKLYSFDPHANYTNITNNKSVILPAESQIIYPALLSSDYKKVGVTVIDLARCSLKEVKLKEYVDVAHRHVINTVMWL